MDLSRASLDRRISLPLLGIDLGRSGPSYGQTLKRMSVAVYGMAHSTFDSEDLPATDLPARFKPPLPTPPPPTAAHRPATDTRPNLGVSSRDPDGSARCSSSNEPPQLLEKTREEHVGLALPPSTTRTPHPGLLSRSLSASGSKVPALRVQRDLQVRRLNLPFKAHVKYPPRGVKLESNRQGKHEFPCPPDPHAPVEVSLDTHQHAKLSRAALESSTSQLDETMRETKLKKKRQTVQELIESERRYFELLNKIQLNYIVPIQASQRANDDQKMILSRKTAAHIFSNFTAILGLSSQFLASLEKFGCDHKIFNAPSPSPAALPSTVSFQPQDKGTRRYSKSGFNIGEMMMQFLPFFKLYTTFTSNFSVSQSTLHLHSAKYGPSPEFKKLLDDCHQRGVDGGLGLAHMLLGIIQRVPRYELLIKELVKHSIPSDCDYHDLLSAQKMVGSVVRGLEVGMNEQTESKTILTIQRAMEGLPFPLVIPSRKLVKLGQMKKMGRKGDLQDRIFFLFNDCLIYSGTVRSGHAESVEKWLGRLTASFQKPNPASSVLASSTASIKPITTSFLLPFTHADDNSPRLVFCRKMELHDVTIIGAVSGHKSNCSAAFQIISSSKSFIICTRDAFEKESWIGCLRETKSELLDSRRTLCIKEDLRDRENPPKFDKLGFIAESPSQEFSPLASTPKKEAFKADPSGGTVDRTPRNTRGGGGETAFPDPVASSCAAPDSEAVIGSSIIGFLSPRARHSSTLTKPFNFNWKNLVQLGLPPTTSQPSQILNTSQEVPTGCLEADVAGPPTQPNAPPEPNLAHQVSDRTRNQTEEYRSLASDYVAENYCAPVWIPDSHVNRCMGQCQTWFSVLKRRHHCRMCGGVFCASCSSRMFLITNREQGDQIARACEGCFQSVFLDPDRRSSSTQPPSGGGAYRPILSNRLHDDQELLFRRERPDLKHSHRQSVPIDMGSAHFRHSLAHVRHDDRRGSIVSAGTSVGGESAGENSKSEAPAAASKTEPVLLHNQKSYNPAPVPFPSHSSHPTHARQQLSSLLQHHLR